MKSLARKALDIAQGIQSDAPVTYVPPSAGTKPLSQSVLPRALVTNTRGYIERVVDQINGTYEKGWFDGCAVMMRRLLETLIIECFEEHGIVDRIKNTHSGDFLYLSGLIDCTLKEKAWNLSRNTKKSLKTLKVIGDLSAHNRFYNAHREDIDKVLLDFRGACQEFIYIAGLK